MNKHLINLLLILISTWSFASQPSIKIVVNDFSSQEESNAAIGKSITDALKLRLSLEERIEMVDLDMRQQSNLKQRTESDPLKEENIQYLISGDFREIDGNISLHITLFNVDTRQSYFLSPKPFNAKEMFISLEGISQDLVSVIYKNAKGASIKTAGLICFKTGAANEKGKSVSDKLLYAVYYNLSSNYSAIRPSDTEKYCGTEDLREIAASIPEVNILITANIEQARNETIIKPRFYITDLNRYFEPLPYQADIADNYYFNKPEDFAIYLNKALDGILLSNGDWNMTILDSETNTKYRDLLSELEMRKSKDSLSDYTSVSLAKQAMEMKPNKAEPYFYYGLILQQQNDLYGAMEYYNKAIEKDPKLKPAYLQLGNLLMDNGAYRRALDVYQKATNNIDDQELKFNLGVAYYFLDSMQQSIDVLENNTFSAELQKEKNYYLGESYYYLGSDAFYSNADYEKAIPYLEKAAKYSGNKHRILTLLITAQNHLSRFSESENLIDSCLEKGWLSLDFYLDQVEHLRNIKSDEDGFSKPALYEAIKYLNKYLEKSEEQSPYPYQLLGSSHFRLDHLDSATYYYKKALEVSPTSMANKLNLSEAAIMSGNYEIAETTLRNSLDSDFNDSKSLGYEVLIHYLLYVKHILNNEETGEDMKEIEMLLNDGNYKYLSWSFATFLKWLDKQEIDPSKKEKIISLTETLVRELKEDVSPAKGK